MNPLQAEVLDALRHAQLTSCICEPGMPEYQATMDLEKGLHRLYWELTHAGPLTEAAEAQARQTLAEILAAASESAPDVAAAGAGAP